MFTSIETSALAFVMSAPRSDVQTIMSQTLRDFSGFDISFTPIYWTYASGFPKVGKMIDKQKGINERLIIF